ncbi:hypothetical protein D3C85_1648060 [compost metagenome]
MESTTGVGILAFSSSKSPVCVEGEVRDLGNDDYEVSIVAGKRYCVSYCPKK